MFTILRYISYVCLMRILLLILNFFPAVIPVQLASIAVHLLNNNLQWGKLSLFSYCHQMLNPLMAGVY